MCTNLPECYAQIRLDYNAKSWLLVLDKNTHISHLHDNNSTVINVYPCQKHFHRKRHYLNLLKQGMCSKIFILLYHDQFAFFQETISGISWMKRIFFHFRRSKIAGIYLDLYIITFNKEVYNYYSMKNVIRKIQLKQIKITGHAARMEEM
jgi:hypothetical protein